MRIFEGMFLKRRGRDYWGITQFQGRPRKVVCVSFIRRNWGKFPRRIEFQMGRGQSLYEQDLTVKANIRGKPRLWQCGEWCDVHPALGKILIELSPETMAFFVIFRIFVDGKIIKPKL